MHLMWGVSLTYASSQVDDTLKELSYSFTENYGEKKIQGVYQDELTDETSRLELSESDGVRTVKHYINDNLVAEATFNTSTGDVVTKNIQTGEEIA